MSEKYWYNKEVPGYILVKWLSFPDGKFAAMIPEFYMEVHQYFNKGATTEDALNYFRNNINVGWEKSNYADWWKKYATVVTVSNERWKNIPESGWVAKKVPKFPKTFSVKYLKIHLYCDQPPTSYCGPLFTIRAI